jgi:hypothetical protein
MKNMAVFLLIIIWTMDVYSYVLNKGESGANLKWSNSGENIVIYVNPTPAGIKSIGISASEVQTIFQASIDEWNNHLSFKIVPIYTATPPNSRSTNTLNFTSNSNSFGSGVLAATSISYNESTGTIISADISMNDSLGSATYFSTDKTISSGATAYIGDVFTHEIGHFLGLSHSEVINSSMIYAIFKNQHSVHSDDAAAVYENYNITKSSGVVAGRVIGGNSIPVFGAMVSALSILDNKVVQSQLTDEDGAFNFKNLATTDSYYFMVKPVEQLDTISNFYSPILTNYCNGQKFKTSFYSQCGSGGRSRPQVFGLSDPSTLDIGDITIRCDENIDPFYLRLKAEATNREYPLQSGYQNSGEVFVGYFSDTEITQGALGLGDEFRLDLSSIDFPGFSLGSLSLKLNLISSGIGSSMDFLVSTKREGDISWTTHTSSSDGDSGKTLTDQNILLNLSSSAANNVFYIKVKPIALTSTQKYEIFSVIDKLNLENSLYVLTSQVGVVSGLSFSPVEEMNSDSFNDNALCPEADVNFTTQGYAPLSPDSNNALQIQPEESAVAVSCATIDIDNDSGPGGMLGSFLLGFCLIGLLIQFVRFPLNSLPE